jgi:hypothetical protein
MHNRHKAWGQGQSWNGDISCMMGVPGATSLIRAEDTMTVDGYLGMVIIERGEAWV